MAAELINAVKDGNSVECARLLEAKADPNLQDDEVSALEMAEQTLTRDFVLIAVSWCRTGSLR